MSISPELVVAKYLKSATKGKVISVKQRRIWTLILIPIWFVMLVATVYFCYIAIKTWPEYKSDKEILERFEGHLYGSYSSYQESREKVFGLIWLAYFVLSIVIPWIIIKLKFWISDAGGQTNPTS